MPFLYSSTATLTMFATRWIGCSWAATRAGNPARASTAAARPSLARMFIAEGIYRNSLERCSPGLATLSPLDDYDGHRSRVAVGQRHVNRGRRQLAVPGFRPPMK